MCDPFTIATIGLTLGSTFLSQRANAQQERARSNAIVAENQRQEALQQQAIQNIEEATGEFTPEQQSQGIEQQAAERTRRLEENVRGSGDTADDIAITGSAPNIVRENLGKSLSEGLQEGKGFAGRLGRFGAFGDLQFGNQLDLARLGEAQGLLGTESRRSNAILPLELQDANKAGSGARLAGDILGGLGSIANLGSATQLPNTGSPFTTDPRTGLIFGPV
jgi:hypothetical protein